MALPPLPFPAVTGRGRRARWRRSVLRRLLAGALAATALLLAVREVRPPPPALTEVAVAARALDPGTVLVDTDLVVRRVPADAVQPGAVRSPAAAVGRRLVAGLAPGEALTSRRLVPRSAADGLAPGRVALHVVAADPAAVDLLPPGTLARVYAVAGGPALARSAVVLAADPVAPRSALGGPDPPRGVVIALSPDEADAVVSGHGGLEGPVTVGLVAVPP